MALRWLGLSLAFAIVATACNCGDPMPPDETFDGNVIVGDGSIPEDAAADAESDAGEADTGGDASSPDVGESDAGDALVDAGDPCSEPAVTVLTASAAVSEIDTWAGMLVEVTGTATQANLRCTDLTCPGDMLCCNTCTSSVTVGGSVLLLGGDCFSPPPGCGGNECTQTCRPALIGVPQRFKGMLIDLGADGVGLELFSVGN